MVIISRFLCDRAEDRFVIEPSSNSEKNVFCPLSKNAINSKVYYHQCIRMQGNLHWLFKLQKLMPFKSFLKEILKDFLSPFLYPRNTVKPNLYKSIQTSNHGNSRRVLTQNCFLI